MHNRKLVIAGLIISNLGIFVAPWLFTLLGSIIAGYLLIKYREWLFSALVFMTAVISGIMGWLLKGLELNLHNPLLSHYDLDNLQFGAIYMIVPLLINLLFIYSFDEIKLEQQEPAA